MIAKDEARADNKIVVTGDANSPITLAVIVNNGGNRPGAAGALSLVITGGNLPAGQSGHFELTNQPTSLKLITAFDGDRKTPSLKIVAAGGGNMKKKRASVPPPNSTKLTLVASGGRN